MFTSAIYWLILIAVGLIFIFRPALGAQLRTGVVALFGGYLFVWAVVLAAVPLAILIALDSPVLAAVVGLLEVIWFLSAIFPYPFRQKAFIIVIAVVVFLGVGKMFLGEDFLGSLTGYGKTTRIEGARQLDRERQALQLFRLEEGTPLYVKNGDVVQYDRDLPVGTKVRLLSGFVETEDGLKYRQVQFPVIIDGEFREGVYDYRSESKYFVTVSFLRETEGQKNGSSPSLGAGKSFWQSGWFWIPAGLLLLFLVYKGLGKTKIDINMVVKIVLIFGGLILFVGVLSALYHDIMGTTHEMGRSKLEYGPEVRVSLVPDLMAQLGHRDEIRVALDPKFRIVELTEPLSVWRTERNWKGDFLVYFGSKKAGVARIPGLKEAVNIFKIFYNLPEATLPRGTLIKFSPHEKPEIIFSAPGALAFGNGETVLAYREVK